MSKPEIRFARYLADLSYPGVDRTKRYRLDDILVINLPVQKGVHRKLVGECGLRTREPRAVVIGCEA